MGGYVELFQLCASIAFMTIITIKLIKWIIGIVYARTNSQRKRGGIIGERRHRGKIRCAWFQRYRRWRGREKQRRRVDADVLYPSDRH